MTKLAIALGTWLIFTAFLGSSAVLAQGIYYRFVEPSWTALLNAILRDGELLVVSTVIAADAVGRLVRNLYLHLHKKGDCPILWLSFVGLLTCVVCGFFTAIDYASSISIRSIPNTEISTLVEDSKNWFIPTLLGAVAIIIATEATLKAQPPNGPGETGQAQRAG